MATESTDRARGTDRMLDILEHLGRNDRAMTAGEIASAIGAPRSTTYTIVDSMVSRAFLQRSEDGLVSLGPKIALLGLAFERGSTIIQAARTIVHDLSRETGEIAELNVLDNWKQLVLLAENGPRQFYLRSVEGGRYPIPQTASGRFLVQSRSPEEILASIPEADYVGSNGVRQTAKQFLGDIEQAKTDGFVCTRGLIEPNVACIAVPIYNHSGKCVAAISLVMTITNFDDRETALLESVRNAGERLSAQMGNFSF